MDSLTVHPDVVHTVLPNGEGVLLHLQTSAYYTLNQSANHIWQLLSNGLELEEISQKLAIHYEIQPTRAKQSVDLLVQELAREKLLQATKHC